MKIVSNGFIEASLAPNGYADANIEINGTVINASNITEISITENVGDNGAFSIGSFNTTTASMTILTEALPSLVTGVPIEIRYGYFVNGHFEYVIMGTFYAEPKDITRSGLFTTIQGYDRSIKLTGAYSSALDWSTAHTVAEVISEIETTLSIEHRSYGGLPHSTIVYEQPKGTYRDAIMQMAALMGGNAKLDQFGYLEFIRLRFSTAVGSYGPYNYQSSDFKLTSDAPASFGKVTVNYQHQNASGEEQTDVYEYTAGSGSNVIALDTVNIRTQAQTNTLGDAVLGTTGFTYYGYNIDLPGQPQIDLGDTISIEDMWGSTKDFIVMQATHTFNGTMTSTFSAVVSDTEPGINDTNINGSITERVSKMNDAVVYAKAKADEATASAAEAERQAGIATTNANTAITQAGIATTNANTAITQAGIATTNADEAIRQAGIATVAASNASTAASNANAAAQNAQGSADAALVSLSNVEDVVGVLEWITAHGTMTSNGSTALDPSKVYFIRDDNGDYHVGNYYYSIVSEPKAEDRTSYYTLSVDKSVQNYIATHIVVDTEGLWLIPDSGGNKVLLATGAGSSYTTAGTYIIGKVNNVDTVFARFATNGATITTENGTQIAHLGYGKGNAQSGTAIAPYYTLGSRYTGRLDHYNSSYTYERGDYCQYNNEGYVCIVKISTPESWNSSHWEKMVGTYSTADGQNIIASGWCSHGEGFLTVSCGGPAHAEGNQTVAVGTSHAEGAYSKARGASSHAEGSNSIANGNYSHAQNLQTIANGESQTVLGKYNVADTTSSLIIGKGTSDTARSNALTVDWNGNVNIASGAKYKINGTNLSASDVGALPLSGGTMTGQLKTSFKSSVAMGSYGAAAATVDGLVTELRYSSGCMGSASIGTAYTKDGITIGTGWYNFIYSPHRSGGANGAASGDNCNYGNLILMGMTVSGSYLIRVSSATISEVRELANYGDTAWSTLATDFNYVKRSGIIFVDFYKTNQSLSTSWTTIGTLPSGYRPNHNLYGAAMTLTTTPIAYFINSSSGVVQMRTATGSGSYVTAFSVAFPVL